MHLPHTNLAGRLGRYLCWICRALAHTQNSAAGNKAKGRHNGRAKLPDTSKGQCILQISWSQVALAAQPTQTRPTGQTWDYCRGTCVLPRRLRCQPRSLAVLRCSARSTVAWGAWCGPVYKGDSCDACMSTSHCMFQHDNRKALAQCNRQAQKRITVPCNHLNKTQNTPKTPCMRAHANQPAAALVPAQPLAKTAAPQLVQVQNGDCNGVSPAAS